MQGRQILTQDALNAHVTQLSNQDIIWAPLYDAATYVGTTGHTNLTFFTNPIGQGASSAPGVAGGTAKSIADTNMTAAGQLTQGNDFYMVGQEIVFYPGVVPGVNEPFAGVGEFLNDTYTFSKAGTLTLAIGSNRTYIQDGPLGMFPPLTRLAVASALAGTSVTGTLALAEVTYAAMGGAPYNITPVYLTATLGFQETLSWPAAVPLPSGVNARVFTRLDGWLIRNAQ
jgi:hypothetical protein